MNVNKNLQIQQHPPKLVTGGPVAQPFSSFFFKKIQKLGLVGGEKHKNKWGWPYMLENNHMCIARPA